MQEAGKGKAIASLVLGIIAVVFWFFGALSLISVVCGIIGIILSASAKKSGYTGGLATGGLVLSIIGLVGGAISFIACVACVGTLGAMGALNS